MDLKRFTRATAPCRTRTAAAVFATALAVSACGDDFKVADDSLVLPASLGDAYPVALSVAKEWADDVIVDASDGSTFEFVQGAGGGFTVMDEKGLAQNHSFQFHSRRKLMNLKVDLFGGIPWTQEAVDAVPPPPIIVNLVPYNLLLDSDVVVPAAIDWAQAANTVRADSIPAATDYAARLLSTPVWPEQAYVGAPADSAAWRVDFLVSQPFGGAGGVTYFSAARFYFHPRTGQRLGKPVVPAQPEVYPFPDGFP